MAYSYIVISLDLKEKEGVPERIGFLGTVETPNRLHTHQTVEINNELYHITDAERKDINMIYVNKVQSLQSLKLKTREYESDVNKQTLGTIMSFLSKHSIKTHYHTGGVRLEYEHKYDYRHQNFQAVGDNLTEAVLSLRNEMIHQGLIKRGEW